MVIFYSYVNLYQRVWLNRLNPSHIPDMFCFSHHQVVPAAFQAQQAQPDSNPSLPQATGSAGKPYREWARLAQIPGWSKLSCLCILHATVCNWVCVIYNVYTQI